MINDKKKKILVASLSTLFALSSVSMLSACGQTSANDSGKTTEQRVAEYRQKQADIDKTIAATLTEEEKESYDLISQSQFDWTPYEGLRDTLCGRVWRTSYVTANDDSDKVEIAGKTMRVGPISLDFERTGRAWCTGVDAVQTMGFWIPCEGGKRIKYVDSSGKVTEFSVSGEHLTAQSDDEKYTFTFAAGEGSRDEYEY